VYLYGAGVHFTGLGQKITIFGVRVKTIKKSCFGELIFTLASNINKKGTEGLNNLQLSRIGSGRL
jgi:hypothetical protein